MLRWLLLATLALLSACSAHKRAEASYDYAPAVEMAGAYDEYADADRASAPAAPSRSRSAGAAWGAEEAMAEPEPEEAASAGSPGQPAPARMVHYDGFARLRVTRVEEGVDQVRAVAEGLGGHVERVGGSSITVRVPVASFRAAFDQVLGLGEVLDKSLTAQDVTDAFTAVDLRLKTAEATRARLQALLARAEEEQEKLQLIKQIQRLTEEIDRLQAQVRTLSALAELSRISVELVPREALAWQGPEAETAELAWIRQLSPLRTDAPLDERDLELPVPDGMVRLDDKGPFVAESPDGARIWAWRVENPTEGDAAFWLAAVQQRLARDFASATAEPVGGWQALRLVDRADPPYTWLVGVRVEGKWLHVVQVFLPSPESAQRHDAAIRAALAGGEA